MTSGVLKKIVCGCFFILSSGIVHLVFAQELNFTSTHFTAENIGLSHNSVLNMTQDRNGFLWISTMDGLNRFDGKSVKIFRHDPADSTTLSDSFIHGVMELPNGLLLVGTRDGGINVLNPETEKIIRHSYTGGKEYGIPDTPTSFTYVDKEGFLWAGFFTHSIGFFDYEEGEYIPANLRLSITGEVITSVNSILEFNDGSFLMSSINGMYYVQSSELEKFRNAPKKEQELTTQQIPFSLNDPTPNSFNAYVDDLGGLWLDLIQGGLRPVDQNMIPSNLLSSINSGVVGSSSQKAILEREQILLKGAGSGQIVVINKDTKVKELVRVSDAPSSVGSAKVFQDRSGNIWFYSWGGGFNLLKEQKGIQLFNGTETNLPSGFMLSFADSEKGMWIGTNSGLALLNEKNEVIPLDTRIKGIGRASIWSLEHDNLGLWIATRKNGLGFIPQNEIESQRYKTELFTPENSLVRLLNVHQVFRDSRGWLWLGYQGEGVQIIKNPKDWIAGKPVETKILSSESGDLESRSISIRRIHEDKQGNIWLATTSRGFIYLKFTGDEITGYNTFENSINADFRISHNDGRHIYQQNDSTFWLATYGGGINRWNSTSGRIKNFRTSEGLANNSTYGILPDQNTRFLWVSTNNGISRLDTRELKFSSFTEADNLQNNEFNTGAFLKRDNGDLIFGGVNGFNSINTEILAINEEAPSVFITEVNLFNRPLEMDSASVSTKSVRLNHEENFLSFEFAALDYSEPLANQYAYKMEGVDDDWVYSGNRSFADYPNLAPGAYKFRVKASNNDGFWNEEGTSLAITITPPWWQTSLFRIIAVLTLLGGLVSFVRYISQRKLRKQIHKMELENKLRNERERISRDLHDHVGSQLANIMSGLSLVDKYNEVEDSEKSSRLVNSLKGDAQNTIKQLRDTIWALNQSDLNLEAFIEHLKTYFKNQSALNEVLDIHFSLDGAPETQLSSTQALNVFRIIQEASQNTLKYAEAKNLDINLAQVNGSLNVSIKDDGTFKSKEKSFNGGYGLGNMKKRAKELGGEIQVNTENGTEIQLSFHL
ncbi:MAG: two-component regulator propeller domain-containing protein [Balneolaceae bacterium]